MSCVLSALLFALIAGCSSSTGGSGVKATAAGSVAAAAGTSAAASGAAAPAGSSAAGAAGGAAGAAGSAAGGKLSFATDVYQRVILRRCTACHTDAPSFGGLAFFPGGAPFAYQNLVDIPAGADPAFQCKDSGLMRVKPGDPEHSLLYLKLTAPPCGSVMPPPAFGTATEEQVQLVRQWIAEGAAP